MLAAGWQRPNFGADYYELLTGPGAEHNRQDRELPNAHWRPRVSHRVILASSVGKEIAAAPAPRYHSVPVHTTTSPPPESRRREVFIERPRVCYRS